MSLARDATDDDTTKSVGDVGNISPGQLIILARTLADMADSPRIEPAHLGEAISYRKLERH